MHSGPRRIVTGRDAQGASRVVSDGCSPGRFLLPDAAFDVLWRVDSLPPRAGDSAEPPGLDRYTMHPRPGTITWVVLEIPLESHSGQTDPDSPEFESSRARFDDAGVYEPGGQGWHWTDTLDFVIVLEGHVDLELDDGVHHLRPGDCVVQTGARHRWVNRGETPCRLSGVIIGAAPAGAET